MDTSRIEALALGHFDGLHRGHFALFNALGENGGLVVIENDNLKLTPIREKFINLPIFYFDIKDIISLSGREFIGILKEKFPVLKRIVVGEDFRFGKGRSCSISELRSYFDGEVVVIKEQIFKDIPIHSFKIRELLKSGEMELVSGLLGRNFSIFARVIKGQGLGKKELFATLNLDSKGYFLPKFGVYAGVARVFDSSYKAAIFLGNRATTDKNFSLEVHILGNFEPKKPPEFVDVEFVKFIRENRKFENLKELKAQISKDIIKVGEILDER